MSECQSRFRTGHCSYPRLKHVEVLSHHHHSGTPNSQPLK